MTISDWISLIILDAVLNGPSFYSGYVGWDDVDEERSRLLEKAYDAGWRFTSTADAPQS